MPVEGYITLLEETNLHEWLHDTLKGFQVPGPDTTLGDLRKQSQALSQSMGEIGNTKERLQKLSSLVARGKGREAIINHSRQVAAYLDEVNRAIGQLRQILESSRTETMRGTLDHLIPRLEESAVRLDQATEALKQEFVSRAAPVQKEPRGHNPGTHQSGGEEGPDQGDDDSPGEGKTPNDDRSDSLNPNNPANQASMDNRSNQMNPNNPAYHSSRGR